MPSQAPSTDLASVLRWEESGATWEVLDRDDARGLTIALLSCDGGDEVGRIVSAEPDLARYVETAR